MAMCSFRKVGSLIMLLIPLLLANAAGAASISYYIDQSNDLPDDVNYLQVTISDGVGGNIDFQVDVLTAAYPAPLSNFGMQEFYFNYDQALDVDMGDITNLDPASWDINEDKNAGGGFGKFNLQAKGSGSSRTQLLTFSIAGVIGDTIYSYALGNADDTGEFFAAHVAGYDDGVSGNTSGKFAGSSVVPIPAAAWMFGSALGLLGWVRRQK